MRWGQFGREGGERESFIRPRLLERRGEGRVERRKELGEHDSLCGAIFMTKKIALGLNVLVNDSSIVFLWILAKNCSIPAIETKLDSNRHSGVWSLSKYTHSMLFSLAQKDATPPIQRISAMIHEPCVFYRYLVITGGQLAISCWASLFWSSYTRSLLVLMFCLLFYHRPFALLVDISTFPISHIAQGSRRWSEQLANR